MSAVSKEVTEIPTPCTTPRTEAFIASIHAALKLQGIDPIELVRVTHYKVPSLHDFCRALERELVAARGDLEYVRELREKDASDYARSISETQKRIDECAPYLKDDETPLQRIERERRDSDGLTTLLAQEKRRAATWEADARNFKACWDAACNELAERGDYVEALKARLKWTRDRWRDVMEDVAEYAQQELGKPIAEIGGLVGGFHAVASLELAACDAALKGEGPYAAPTNTSPEIELEAERNLAESWGRWHDYKFASTFRDILCRTLDKTELYARQGKPLPQDEIDAMAARLAEATEQLDAIGRPVKPHRSGGGESPGVGTAPK